MITGSQTGGLSANWFCETTANASGTEHPAVHTHKGWRVCTRYADWIRRHSLAWRHIVYDKINLAGALDGLIGCARLFMATHFSCLCERAAEALHTESLCQTSGEKGLAPFVHKCTPVLGCNTSKWSKTIINIHHLKNSFSQLKP